jgi:hypothetical protein
MGKIKNGLEKALNWGKAAIVSLPLIAGVYGCEKEPSEAQLEISPNYGKHPLTTRIKLDGIGNDGKITNYILTIDGKKIRDANYPLDTLMTFKNYGVKDNLTKQILGEIIDSKGNKNKQIGYIKIYARGVNEFVQPNDSTLNWYGSGDVNNDNIRNSQDLERMVAIINGTYSNPNDKRLYDRADVNGDEVVNSEDVDILSKKLNGTRLYLPGEWNLLLTWAEREDWFKKMLKIDKTDEIPPTEDFDCDQHVYQLMMNFSDFNSEELKKFKEDTPAYDTINNCRFNIPIEFVGIAFYDINNKPLGSHAVGGVIFGNNALNMGDRCNFETETDAVDVDIGKDYYPASDHQRVWIHGRPVVYGLNEDGTLGVVLTYYLEYSLKDYVYNLVWTNPKINLIEEREK